MDPEEALWDSKTVSLSLLSERKCEKDIFYCSLQDARDWAKNQGRLVVTDPQDFGTGSTQLQKLP